LRDGDGGVEVALGGLANEDQVLRVEGTMIGKLGVRLVTGVSAGVTGDFVCSMQVVAADI
jgi:hypothetical protein